MWRKKIEKLTIIEVMEKDRHEIGTEQNNPAMNEK